MIRTLFGLLICLAACGVDAFRFMGDEETGGAGGPFGGDVGLAPNAVPRLGRRSLGTNPFASRFRFRFGGPRRRFRFHGGGRSKRVRENEMQIDNGHEDPLGLDGVDVPVLGQPLPKIGVPKIVGEKDSAIRRQTPDVIEEAISSKGQDVEWWKDYINEMAKKRLIDELSKLDLSPKFEKALPRYEPPLQKFLSRVATPGYSNLDSLAAYSADPLPYGSYYNGY